MIASPLVIACLAAATICADLPAEDYPLYEASLRSGAACDPADVQFRDLWEHPASWRGKGVRIEGRVARRFFAPASGTLPAREELWIATDDDNLLCAVFPQDGGRADLPLHARATFAGVALGTIRYRSGDVDRLAPLIVGPSPPQVSKRPEPTPSTFSTLDWTFVAVALGLVACVLMRIPRKPPRRDRPDDASPVEFVS